MTKTLVLVAISFLLITPLHWFIRPALKRAANGWKKEPKTMIKRAVFSFVFGQGIFWILGYDQLGLFMSPFAQFGLGQRVAAEVYEQIPHTTKVAWIIKVLEIITDAGKIPIEGLLYIRTGFSPDGLANLVTQPLWSTLETAEKITGAITRPEIVATKDQVILSLGCIYGSMFRYLLAGLMFLFAPLLYAFIGQKWMKLRQR